MAWLGAIQAQDYAGAKWAVGLRLGKNATDAMISQAIAEGTVLRTHAMRCTWQLVAPADIRWILDLVGPRMLARHAKRLEEVGFDKPTLRRGRAVILRALRDGAHRTRAELAAALRRADIAPDGSRLAHLLGHIELEGLICSGAPRGKQQTHAAMDTRAPNARRYDERDEALAELARRYFQSRGPATIDDFTWWSSLIVGEAKRALDIVAAELVLEVIDGRTYWHAGAQPVRSRRAYMLPPFDEYLVAYRHRDGVLAPVHAKHHNAGGGMLHPCIVLAGNVIGIWRRTLSRGPVDIEMHLFGATTSKKKLLEAARAYGAFLGLDVNVV